MNFKEFLIPLMLALLGTWAIEYFFFNKKTLLKGFGHCSLLWQPTGAQEEKPLNTAIDFIDTKRSAAVIVTEVETNDANLFFSTDGASLDRLEFKRKG